MGDRIRKWIAVLLAGSILAMIQLVPAGGAVFVRENIENKEILGEKETSLQQTLHARAWVLMDADSGRILAGKDADTAYPMASTTKILTCILALEQGNPDDWVEVSEKAASMPDVQLNMRAGERYRLSDLLYSLMLESHNDSAVAVAEHIGGSAEGFAEKMNRKAREIGCKNVCFVTPNGLDVADEDGNEHSASAADMARIMRYCAFQSPCRETFLEITRTASRTIQDESGNRSFYLANHNALLSQCAEVLSGKTGFTGKAGYCYVGAVKKGEKFFIMALLGCGWPPHKTYKWQDVRKLVQYGETNFEYRVIEKTGLDGESVIAVKDGVEPEVKVRAENGDETSIRILLGKDEDVRVRTKIAGTIQAPVREGTPVGQRDYMIGDVIVASDPVLTTENVEVWDFGYAERIVMKKFWQL